MTTQPPILLPLTLTAALFTGGAVLASWAQPLDAAPMASSDPDGTESPEGAASDDATGTPGIVPSEAAAASPDAPRSSEGRAPAPAPPAGLTVHLDGVQDRGGKLVVIVFADEAAFAAYDVDRAVAYEEVAAKAGRTTLRMPWLRAGSFAVSVWHDANGNRALDMKGEWPTEGYGTSGRVGKWDTPAWSAAAVPPGEVAVRVHYP